MFIINNDKSIYLTRGDSAIINVTVFTDIGEQYIFQPDDVIKLKIVEKNHYDRIVLEKAVYVSEETSEVTININSIDTKFGPVINKPKDYWYEIELSNENVVQTIIGYDINGPKIFRMYPEGVENI